MNQRIGFDSDIEDGETINVIPEQQTDQDKGLDDWLHEVGGDKEIRIRIYSEEHGHNDPVYLFAFQPHDMDMGQLLDKVKQRYGGGKYRAKCYGPNPKGGTKIVMIFNRAFEVGNEKEPDMRQIIPPQNDGAISELTGMMTKFMEDSNKRTEMLMMLLLKGGQQQPASAQPSMMEMQSSMMGNMLQMKELMGDAPKTDNMEMLFKGMEFMKEMGGGGDTDTNGMDVFKGLIETFGKPLAEAVSNLPTTQTSQPHQNQQIAPNQTAPAKQPAQPQTEGKPQMNMATKLMIKFKINALVKAAGRNTDPVSHAESLIDEVPEEILLGQLKNDLFPTVCQVNAEAKNYEPWFRELEQNLKIGLGLIDPPSGDENLTDAGEGAINSDTDDDPGTGSPAPDANKDDATCDT